MKKCFPLYKQVLCGLVGLLPFVFASCEEEKKELVPTYLAGVLVFTEGPAGELSFYSRATGTVEEDVFQKVNSRALTGPILATTPVFDRLYLITGAQQIEVLQSNTLTSAGLMEGLPNPQRLVALNSRRGFVSGFASPTDSGQVFEVNLGTLEVTDTLKTGKMPTAMAASGSRLFVANAAENQVNVFNTSTQTLEGNLTVGLAPNSMVIDGAGNLWVLSGGTSTTSGRLVRVNPRSPISETNPPIAFDFPGTASQPSNLVLSATKNRFYFLNNGVYVMDMNATTLPTAPLIRRNFRFIAQDPTDGLLYAARISPDRSSSWIVRYQSSGTLVDSFQVKGVATGFHFR